MRTGKVLLVMVAVLAMSGAASAQIFAVTVDYDLGGSSYSGDIYQIDPYTPSIAAVANNGAGFRSAGSAVVGQFHYSERYNDGDVIVRVDLTNGNRVFFTKTYDDDGGADGNFNMTASLDGTIWELDIYTPNLYPLVFNETSQTVSRGTALTLPQSIGKFGDIAWGPDGKLYIATNGQGNFIWDPGTSVFQSFSDAGNNYNGLAWYEGRLYGSLNVGTAAEDGGALYELDPSNMVKLGSAIINSPNYRLNDLASWPLEEPVCETDLIAGGGDGIGIDVGEVTTALNDDSWDVLFKTTGPWEIAEVHLDVACEPGDIPQTKKNNPIPGQFCFQDTLTPVSQSYLFEDVLASLEGTCNHSLCGGDECTYFAAHAVVKNYTKLTCDDEAGRIFGVEQVTGDLYEINLTTATATLVADIDDPVPSNENSPNGLAFDVKTGRWYFSAIGDSNSSLWFWDGANQVDAGVVPGEVAGAAFYNGEYYYVVNETDDLVKVQFAGDGSVAGVVDVCPNFAGEPDYFRFGDIVIAPDGSMLYGSSIGSGDPTVFFTIDLRDCTYAAVSADGGDGSGLQLALGSDGKLYGHSTGSGNFFEVDPATGATTLLGMLNKFTDLAAGPCSPWEETAWGSGMQFDGKNWGMYFGCNCED